MAKFIVRCPDCDSKVLQAKLDGTSWCRICGWKGKTEETRKPLPTKG